MEIYTESRETLLSLDFVYALALRITELNLSRTKATDWLVCKIFFFDGTIYDWSGRPLYISSDIVDRAYGKDVATGTWNDAIKAFVTRPPVRRPKHALLLRLALWDAAMKINGTPVLG